MIKEEEIAGFRNELAETGTCVLTDPQGRRLFIVLSRILRIEGQGLLLSYEKEGSFYFTLDRPLNQFRLIAGGFSLMVAPTLSALVNALLYAPTERAETRDIPRLESPRGPGDDDE